MKPRLSAREFVQPGPLATEPAAHYVDRPQRQEAIESALAGITLGAFDRRMIIWFCRSLDLVTCMVLVSWLLRARGAGMIEVLDLEHALRRHHQTL